MSVNCFNGVTYQITAGAGQFDTGSQKRMSLNGATGGPYLLYTIYSDMGRTIAFPTSTAAAPVQTANGSDQATAVYASVLAQTASSVGNYSDTIALTIIY